MFNLHPDVALAKQARPVAPPVRAGPASALQQELGAILEGCFHHALGLILNPRLPSVAHKPPRDKIIVICIHDVLPPHFRLETLEELMAG